ncbi:MAG: ABC transporter permease [Bryobacterales bacterium]|nr:ABC transporter permease [Bryobacterales bacterium]
MFRYAVRMLRKSPGFTAIAVATLTLGIGANTAIFSVVNSVLLRALPLRDPDRLVFAATASPDRGLGNGPLSNASYEILRDRNQSFSGVAAYAAERLPLTGSGEPEQLQGARVSPNFFSVLGSEPERGRAFDDGEGKPGAAPVAIISHRLWERRFGSGSNFVRKSITIAGEPHTIIGVMPPGYGFPFPGIDIWVTRLLRYTGLPASSVQNGGGYLLLVARLRPGATLSTAAAGATVLFHQYVKEYAANPDADPRARINVLPFQENFVSDIRLTLWILTGAVALVLLIASANVAGLMMARATGRAKEIALRAALGASRGAIVRQLLVESLLLSAAGAIGGIMLAQWLIPALAAAPGIEGAALRPIRIDTAVLAFTVAIAFATGAIFGLLPAWQASRPDLNSVLRESGWGSTQGPRRHTVRGLLVAAQIALSTVLLIGAALLLQSFLRLRKVNPGFDPNHTLTLRLTLPDNRYHGDAARTQFVRELMSRLAAIPGVISASASTGLPMSAGLFVPILCEGQQAIPYGRRPIAEWNPITPDYFKATGIPILQGRTFDWSDDPAAPPRAIVSQSLARKYWPNENPIGKHVTYARRQIVAEVIGVAGDVKERALDSDMGLVFYTSYPQFTWPNVAFAIRAAGDPTRLANAATAQVFAIGRDMPVTDLQTMQDYVARSLGQRREFLYAVGAFAALALILALVGIYGLVAYAVTERTSEFAIRQAIGATRRDILAMVLRQNLRLSAAGIAAGAAVAAFATPIIATMLYAVAPTDPWTFACAALLFLTVSLAAGYIPARRATRLDPVIALRL